MFDNRMIKNRSDSDIRICIFDICRRLLFGASVESGEGVVLESRFYICTDPSMPSIPR